MHTVAEPALLADLTTRLERLTPRHSARWGRMTAHQMAAHLANAAEAALARRPFAAPARRPNPVLKFLSLRLPLPWPKNVRTGADPAGIELAPETFEAERIRALTALRDLSQMPAQSLASRHPIFGAMTQRDWHRWAFLHTDHHLRQFGL